MRAKKFVLWLHNKTNSVDDEWVVVWAKTRAQAKKKVDRGEVNYESYRFFPGRVLTAAEFKSQMGFGA